MNKKILSIIISACIVLGITISSTWAWTGLVAQVWDIITVAKWNEMITELNTKITETDIVAGTGITVSTAWAGVTISMSDGSVVAPFVNPDNVQLAQNTNYTIDISGVYFTPTTTVSIPGFDGTINSVTATTPNTLQVNITTGPNITDYDIVLDNGWVNNTLWPGNGANYMSIVTSTTWNGPAGTYTETFEAGLWNWVNTGWSQPWTRNSWWTPSNGTGPLNGAGWSTWYIFTEASGANSPNVDFAIQTDNFNIAQSISFDYHMIWANMWSLELQTFYNWSWTTRWSITGTQQWTQGDPYINQVVNLSTFQVELIRFVWTSGNGWSSDVTLDNLIITSI